ncbi:MAG: hypothetical protein A2161_06400 [Candidatus Schekmanbacteria bacterium RBG_13_48_7]|uniref:Uncharacterized protein n=1 Tax=Candidatus Schekmanbacteria bacterium RBG_13_48_7 TaxID=1817878 RepID=A0A1F7RY68_9BACT|nr:MAG: hypothetical protein A2161_06400 [Candidatus Schekmanbacteria bacterium RBG_13_48_7]
MVLKESLFQPVDFGHSIGATPIVIDGEIKFQTVEGKILPTVGASCLLRFPNTYGTRQALIESDGISGTILPKWFGITPQQENIELRTNGFIKENTHWTEIADGATVYHLDFDFKLTSVVLNQPYKIYRGTLDEQGWLAKSVKAELADLHEILYWNGNTWEMRSINIEK